MDRPILFNGPMVRALLGGRKTQTRRILKPQPEQFDLPDGSPCIVDCTQLQGDNENRITLGDTRCGVITLQKVHFAIGDRLWVRESMSRANGEAVGYMADGTWLPNTPWPWQRNAAPSIHMPRWASRLTLTVTDVRIERLQEISETDAIAEGIEAAGPNPFIPESQGIIYHDGIGDPICDWTRDPVEAFRNLWNNINGPNAWDQNPWVVALTFDVERRNIDAPAKSLGDVQ